MMTLFPLRFLYPHRLGHLRARVSCGLHPNPPLLPPPTTRPSGSRAVNQDIRRSVLPSLLPWLLLLRLCPTHTNLHSRAETASLN
jgi:hypothetical protein